MSERPFLPKSRVRRVFAHPGLRLVGMWVLLGGVFFVIWFGIVSSPESTPSDLPPVDEAPVVPGGTFDPLLLSPLVCCVISMIAVAWFVTRNRRFVATNGAGLKSFADGDYAEAAQIFASLPRWPRTFRAVAASNLGLAHLHAGRLSEALECFTDAERASSSGPAIKANAATNLALANALRG